MNVLILAAGYGTRLYPLIKDIPKALLKIKEKPLIDYIVDKIKYWPEVDHIYVVTNDKFCKNLEQWAKESYPLKKIKIINDRTTTPDERLGSIGDIAFALKEENIQDDLLVVGSDNLFDYSLDGFLKFAKKQKEKVSIGVYDIQNTEAAKKFGVVNIDSQNKIILFEEKPAVPKSTLIGMCLYYFPKNSLSFINKYLLESTSSDRAGDYIRWLSSQQNVYAFKFMGKWFDIGSIESFNEAQQSFN